LGVGAAVVSFLVSGILLCFQIHSKAVIETMNACDSLKSFVTETMNACEEGLQGKILII
jgi:hypothetical protein